MASPGGAWEMTEESCDVSGTAEPEIDVESPPQLGVKCDTLLPAEV